MKFVLGLRDVQPLMNIVNATVLPPSSSTDDDADLIEWVITVRSSRYLLDDFFSQIYTCNVRCKLLLLTILYVVLLIFEFS